MSSPSTFRCQHKGRSSWDTHPSCMTCRIREEILCSRDNPCFFCQDLSDNAWHNKALRVKRKCLPPLFLYLKGPPPTQAEQLGYAPERLPAPLGLNPWSLLQWISLVRPWIGCCLCRSHIHPGRHYAWRPWGETLSLTLNTLTLNTLSWRQSRV